MAAKPEECVAGRMMRVIGSVVGTGAVLLLLVTAACESQGNQQAKAGGVQPATTLAPPTVKCDLGTGPNKVKEVLLVTKSDTTKLVVADTICGVIWDGAANLPVPTQKKQVGPTPLAGTPVCKWIGDQWVCTTGSALSADSTAKSGQ